LLPQLKLVLHRFLEGGLGEAVKGALESFSVPVYCLAVRKMPKSGKPEELLDYEEISKNAIVKKIKEII
jgi:transketolase